MSEAMMNLDAGDALATPTPAAEGDNMNLEELKRKIDEFQDATRSCAIHGDMEAYAEEVEATKDALLTAILAKLEAAQRLRLCIKAWIESVPEYSQLAKNLEEALAAFDKEQQ